jgi:hypothetical protein
MRIVGTMSPRQAELHARQSSDVEGIIQQGQVAYKIQERKLVERIDGLRLAATPGSVWDYPVI